MRVGQLQALSLELTGLSPEEGVHAPKMSIGLHLRIIGRLGRIAALNKILGHVADRGNTWIARRIDTANRRHTQFPET